MWEKIHIKGNFIWDLRKRVIQLYAITGTFSKQTDEIVTESPITIKLNGEEYVTVVCTPNYIEDMVIGF